MSQNEGTFPRIVTHGTLVKWEGDLPRGVAFRQWLAGKCFVAGLDWLGHKIDPIPMNHPRCLEVISISTEHDPITTYRRQ